MIVQKDFLNKLKDFGLNSYEAKLWTALLSRGVSTAGELSDIANVPRSRSYDVLESLEKKGFVIMKIGKPIKYVAVPPTEVILRVKKKVEEDTERQVKFLENLEGSEVLNELTLLHTNGIEMVDPIEMSGSLKGRENMYDHVDSMMKFAEKSIVICTTTSGLKRKADRFRKQIEKAKKRGIKVRIIAPLSSKNLSSAKELSEFAELRHSDDAGRFLIIDGKQILFMLTEDEIVHPAYDSAIWVNSPYYSSNVEKDFEGKWDKAKPFKQLVIR